MSWTTWSVFAVMDLLLCLTPGPAVLYVVSQGLSQGPVKSIYANLGILTANLTYFAISATGLATILIASYDAFFAIKWIGVVFLVWLGLTTFFGKAPTLKARKEKTPPRSPAKIWAGGVVLQLANPKAILFFAALLPPFIDPSKPVAGQMLILAATSTVIEFCTQLMYGTLAGRAARFAEQPAFATWIDRAAGGFLITAAILMAAIHKS